MEEKPEQRYVVLGYICSGCGVKRDVVVNPSNHLSRAELKSSGLASYIDIHDGAVATDRGQHGMKLHVDANFHVRSNEILASDTQRQKIIEGLPLPAISVNLNKLMYISRSWNSLEITSQHHNLGYYLINPEPTESPTDLGVTSFESELGTIKVKVAFQKSRIGKEGIELCRLWLDHLLNWMEQTASLNANLIPRLLFYIDFYAVMPPSVSDEMILSILMDGSAKFLMTRNYTFQDTEEITKIDQNTRRSASEYYDLLGINIDALNAISSKLNDRKKISIKSLTNLLTTYRRSDQFLDTFIVMFVELFKKNAIDYEVSHLL